MDAKSVLEELLQTGRQMAAKSQAAIEQKLDIAEPGEKRDATLSGMKTGAVAAGVLALLLGTGAGRRVTGSALKLEAWPLWAGLPGKPTKTGLIRIMWSRPITSPTPFRSACWSLMPLKNVA